ncbi:MAG: DNA polymerase III subunit chi [Comamonadaceae bacterium]|jgi:DNA polymerase-3 subunit chi
MSSLVAVAFHTGVADAVVHLRRLVAKALKLGEPMVVICDPAELDATDLALWSERSAFAVHCRYDAPAAVLNRTPVVLATEVSQVTTRARLVNISGQWVADCETFARVVEVVTPSGAAAARDRWKRYAQLGAELTNTGFGA